MPEVRDQPIGNIDGGAGEVADRVDEFDPRGRCPILFDQGGDTVGVESFSTGRTLDGKLYENDYAWVFRVSNGKIDRLHEYMDSHYTAKLFGMD